MDEESGERKAKLEMMSEVAHLRRLLQFLGLAGSEGLFQVTCFSLGQYLSWWWLNRV